MSYPFLPSVHVRPRKYYKTAHVEHEGKMLGSILVTAKKLIFYITTLIKTCFDVYNSTKQMTDLMKVSHTVKKSTLPTDKTECQIHKSVLKNPTPPKPRETKQKPKSPTSQNSQQKNP